MAIKFKLLERAVLYSFILLIFYTSACKPEEVGSLEENDQVINYIDNENLMNRLEKLLNYPVDSMAFPRSMSNGVVRGVPSSDWTSGFLPGSLWYAYRLTEDDSFKQRASEWTELVDKEKWNDRTHDMGFKIYCSFGNGYEITQDQNYADVIVQSAKTLSTRYNSRIGSLRSWDFNQDEWLFPVIIDNMMNLELLFEATEITGDSTFYDIAYQHALTTLKNHFRDDNSSYHVVDYHPISGEVRMKVTHQGHSDESSWARGQAWGLYGFTMAYRYTQDERFLEQAVKIRDFLFNHQNIPNDKVFYWDFNDPQIPNSVRDASAAAITASALLELYTIRGNEDYLSDADELLSVLASPDYMLDQATGGPFILTHSTGNMPKNDEVDGPIAYADYYFLEAIWRRQQLGL